MLREKDKKNQQESNFATTPLDSLDYYRKKLYGTLALIDSLKKRDNSTIIMYKIKPGDNLSSIAYLFYNDISKATEIARHNNLENPNLIIANQILNVEINH